MDEENEFDMKRRLRKALVIMPLWIIFFLCFFIFFDFFRSCNGVIVFSVIYALLIIFAHFFLREERKTFSKYLYYVLILLWTSTVGFWLLDTLSECSWLG